MTDLSRPRSSRGQNESSPAALPQGVPKATKEIVQFCFETLWDELEFQAEGEKSRRRPSQNSAEGQVSFPPPPELPQQLHQTTSPLFVTWLKKQHEPKHNRVVEHLRGCIGSLEPICWQPGIRNFALKSSLKDSRFDPISAEELPDLVCKFSVLHTYEDLNDPYNWIIGTHGITVSFEHNGKRYSATYMPEVALEHNMSQDDALTGLIKKSGFPYQPSVVYQKLYVTRYQSSVERMDYKEWLERRRVSATPSS